MIKQFAKPFNAPPGTKGKGDKKKKQPGATPIAPVEYDNEDREGYTSQTPLTSLPATFVPAPGGYQGRVANKGSSQVKAVCAARKLTVGIDIDGVIADFNLLLREIASQYIPVVNEDDSAYKIKDLEHGTQEVQDKVMEEVYEDHRIPEASTIKGAVEKINEIYDKGYNVIILTARQNHWYDQTEEWLKKIGLKYHKLVHDSDKGPRAVKEGIDVFIDDKPENVRDLIEHGINAYVFDQPWNQGEDLPRLHGWKNVKAFVTKYAAEWDPKTPPSQRERERQRRIVKDPGHMRVVNPNREKEKRQHPQEGYTDEDTYKLHRRRNIQDNLRRWRGRGPRLTAEEEVAAHSIVDILGQLGRETNREDVGQWLHTINLERTKLSSNEYFKNEWFNELEQVINAILEQEEPTLSFEEQIQITQSTRPIVTLLMKNFGKQLSGKYGKPKAGGLKSFTKFAAPRWTTNEKNRLKELYLKYRERGVPHHIIYKAAALLLGKSFLAVKQKLENMYEIDEDLGAMKYEHWNQEKIDQMIKDLYTGGQSISRMSLPANLMYQITNHSLPKAETCGFPAFYDSFDHAMASNILAVGFEREGDKLTESAIETIEDALKYYRRKEKMAHAWNRDEIVSLLEDAHVAGLPLTYSFFKSHPDIYKPLIGVGRSLEGLRDSIKRCGYNWADLVIEAAPEYVDFYTEDGRLKSSTEEMRIRRFLELNEIPFRVANAADKIPIEDPELLEQGYKNFIPDFFILDCEGNTQAVVEVFGSVADSAAANTSELYREKKTAKEKFYQTQPFTFIAINNNADGVDLTDEILREKFSTFMRE